MTTYYAVCNANGPISVRLNDQGVTGEGAKAEFATLDPQTLRGYIDEPRTDAEDDLDISGEGMDESEFMESMFGAGAKMVDDLEHGGRHDAPVRGGWVLWSVSDGV